MKNAVFALFLMLTSLSLAQKTTINVLAVADLADLTQSVADAYMKEHPDVTIELERLPFDQLFQQIQVRLSGGSPSPDVLYVDAPVVASYGVQNFLAPLDDYFAEEDLAAFLPALVGTSIYKDQLLATPVCSSSMMIYYNKNILEQQGIALPSSDVNDRMTWEAFAELAQKATIRDGTRVESWGLTLHQPVAPYQILTFPESLGGKPIAEDGLTTTGVITTPEWIKAMTFYFDLHNTWNVSPKGNVDGWQLFSSGKAAFFQGVTFFASQLPADAGFEMGFMPNPYFEGGTPVTTTDCWHVGVNRNSANIAVAADFVKYLSNGAGQDLYWQEGQLDPVLKRHADIIATDPKYDGSAQRLAALEGGTTAVARPVTPGFSEYQDILTQAFSNIRNGQDPASALTDAAAQIDRALAKYR